MNLDCIFLSTLKNKVVYFVFVYFILKSLRQLELEKSRFDENKIKERKEFEEYKENEIRKLKLVIYYYI